MKPASRTAKILGGLLLAVSAGLIVEWTKDFPLSRWLIDRAKELWEVVVTFGHWLAPPAWIPFWVATLLVGFALLTIVGMGLWLWVRHLGRSAFTSYRSDSFLGVQWHWNYIAGRVDEHTLSAICPRCSYRMVYGEARAFQMASRTRIYCEDRGYEQEFEGELGDLRRRVVLLVDRNLRLGNVPGLRGARAD